MRKSGRSGGRGEGEGGGLKGSEIKVNNFSNILMIWAGFNRIASILIETHSESYIINRREQFLWI